jgi:hypothetical protein
MSIAIIVGLLWSVIGLFIYRVSRQRQHEPLR